MRLDFRWIDTDTALLSFACFLGEPLIQLMMTLNTNGWSILVISDDGRHPMKRREKSPFNIYFPFGFLPILPRFQTISQAVVIIIFISSLF
jgi:hypothetical protein